MWFYKRFIWNNKRKCKETMYILSYDSEDEPGYYRKTYWWDWKVWEVKIYKLRLTKYVNNYEGTFDRM